MKHLTKLFTLSVAMLASLALFGAGSASATVLCQSAPENHVCSPSQVYGVGTKISAKLSGNAKFTTYGGTTVANCSQSEIEATVSNQNQVKTNASSYTFSNCTTGSVTNVGYVPGFFYIHWLEGTHGGQVEGANTFSIPFFGEPCTYMVVGYGELVSGSAPSLAYKGYEKAAVLAEEYENSVICPAKLRFSATYTVNAPTPLYVEQS
jgi:hypothetical protein